MLNISRIAAAFAVVLGSTSSALAASAPRADSSGLVVWIFLGFCALIIVAQLVPAVLMMFGMVKGIAGSRKPAAVEAGN